MAKVTRSAKKAVVCTQVPACLSHTGAALPVGTEVTYTKDVFRNGEFHLIVDGKQVPSVFFDY